MNKLKYKTIAVDFDGTIVDLAPHPEWGEVKPYCADVLKMFKAAGGTIIIWTCRGDSDEKSVKEFLDKHEIPYDYFNEHSQSSIDEFGPADSPKVFADVYIDDRSIHCKKIDWLQIYDMLIE